MSKRHTKLPTMKRFLIVFELKFYNYYYIWLIVNTKPRQWETTILTQFLSRSHNSIEKTFVRNTKIDKQSHYLRVAQLKLILSSRNYFKQNIKIKFLKLQPFFALNRVSQNVTNFCSTKIKLSFNEWFMAIELFIYRVIRTIN